MTREEALKIVCNIYQTDKEKEALGVLIPELADSEDERTREFLINFIKLENGTNLSPDDAERCIAYLEKLKEQKPVLAYDENGDAILSDFEAALFSAFSDAWQTYLHGEDVNVVEWAKEHAPELLRVAGKPADISDLRDWKFIVDAVLTEHEGIGQYLDKPETEQIAKKLQERFSLPQSKPVEWSEEDGKLMRLIISILKDEHAKRFYRSDEMESGVYAEELVDFLENLRPQQKVEWSEEEKGILLECISVLQNSSHWVLADKLKSLRPQPHWKPSEEHM